MGAILIGHPLSGSIGPGESPCKSLLLKKQRGALNISSLQLIESALEALRKSSPQNRDLPPDILEDFRVIDLDLLDSAVSGIRGGYAH